MNNLISTALRVYFRGLYTAKTLLLYDTVGLIQPDSMEYLERLATYISWPVSGGCSPIRLASAGFRYSGVDDELTCDSCGLIIRDWRQRTNLDRLHQHDCRTAATSGDRSSSPVIAADRRHSPTAVSTRPPTASTKLPLAVPAAASVDAGMASRDTETSVQSAWTGQDSSSTSGSGDDRAAGTALDQTTVAQNAASETRTEGCCAAQPGGCSATVNNGRTLNASNNPGQSGTGVESKVFVLAHQIFNMYSNGHGVHSNGHGNSKNI